LTSFGHVAILVVAIAAILGLSAGQLQKERRQLQVDLAATQSVMTETAAHELGTRLSAFDRDTGILASLVARARQSEGLDLSTQNRVIRSAFEGLVAVVPHYRTMALYSRDGSTSVMAVDPAEQQDTITTALFVIGQRLARSVAAARGAVLEGPTPLGNDRFFYLFAAPVGADEVIVLASDAGMLLNAALSPGLSDARHLILDPRGAVWTGCERSIHCQPLRNPVTEKALRGAPPGHLDWLDADRAGRMSLPRSAALLTSARVAATGGDWTLAIVSPAGRLDDREPALLRRLIVTGLAAALAVVAVGVFILRQQRDAAALKERLHTAQELATLREKSDAIIENAPIGILGVAEDGKVMIANRFLVDRVGPIHTGRPWDDAFPSESDGGARQLRTLLDRARGDPHGRAEQSDLNLRAVGAGDFDVTVVSLRHPADEVRLLALIEDRTAVRNLERQLIRTEKILTAGVISAGLAHEIGTPISVIRGRAEHLAEVLAGTPLAADLAAIVRHSDGIASTIRQVLDFSHAQPIQVVPVDATSALERARELLDWKLLNRQICLSTAVESGVGPFAADADQLQQVLVNLILNACDACADGGAVRVEVARTEAGDKLRLSVQDNGTGISPENMNAVFDPFFTTKKRGEGTGLGLTVVASIVRDHGGAVTLTSAPGKGTTVAVLWPTARVETQA
jgi:signal transduction histidine kinase